MSEDSVTLTGCIGVHLRRIPLIQKKVVKQKVDLIGSEIPIYVLVMQKTNVTGRFTLVRSIFSHIISFEANILFFCA